MSVPAHVAPVGHTLAPDYFSPGTTVMNGRVIGSSWAIAYYAGHEYRYERAGLGLPWVRVA